MSANWFGRDDLANSELRGSEFLLVGNAKVYDLVGIGWFGIVFR